MLNFLQLCKSIKELEETKIKLKTSRKKTKKFRNN